MMGLPTISATIATQGVNGQLDSRLWDVAPDGNADADQPRRLPARGQPVRRASPCSCTGTAGGSPRPRAEARAARPGRALPAAVERRLPGDRSGRRDRAAHARPAGQLGPVQRYGGGQPDRRAGARHRRAASASQSSEAAPADLLLAAQDPLRQALALPVPRPRAVGRLRQVRLHRGSAGRCSPASASGPTAAGGCAPIIASTRRAGGECGRPGVATRAAASTSACCGAAALADLDRGGLRANRARSRRVPMPSLR